MQNITDHLNKRAKRKYINTPVLSALLTIVSPLHKKYLTSVSCASALQVLDGSIKSRYCKRLWCTICAPIKTAIRLNSYSSQLNSISDLQFTTLTIPNVPGHELKSAINHFRKVLKQFRNTYNKRSNAPFIGVYNFEVTLNLKAKNYHPHIHIIHSPLSGCPVELINYWLKKTPSARSVAQDTRPCTDLIEGFKYANKSTFYTVVDGQRVYNVPATMLDIMYNQLSGIRMFNSFGIAKVDDKIIDAEMDKLEAYKTDALPGTYLWKLHDWFLTMSIDQEGELQPAFYPDSKEILFPLTNYIPHPKHTKIFNDLSQFYV